MTYTVAGAGPNPATGSDFVGGAVPSGTMQFVAGQTTSGLVIGVAGDTTVEPDETFTVTLSGAGLTFTTQAVTSTILNDDAVTIVPPTFAIAAADATKKEGNSGTTPFTFTVTRSGDTSGSATLGYSFAGSGANAADASDFPTTGLFYNSVSFSPGDVSKTITVYVNGDTTVERDETFTVTLTGDSYSTITTATATGTILNDDAATVTPPPTTFAIAAADASKKEGSSGTTPFTFTVIRSGDASSPATLAYAVTGSGANPASTADFAGGALPSGSVAFAAGDTSKTLTVNVVGDTAYEPDETFTVTLSGEGQTFTTASATGAIQNDDAPSTTPASFAIAASDGTKKEGNSGTTAFNFTIIRSGDPSAAATLGYAVTGTGSNPANAADFIGGALPSGTISFAAGETSKGLVIGVAGDGAVEPDETFTVTLSGAGLTFTTASAASIIQNDDVAVVAATSFAVTAIDAAKKEGNSGATAFTFTVARSGDASAAASLGYAVSGSGSNPASATDFVGGALPSGVVAFAAGETSKVVTVNVAGDTAYEPEETFDVTLSGAGVTFTTVSATGVIQNDDAPGPVLGIQNGKTGAGSGVNMDVADASGPGYLTHQYIYSGSDDLSIATSAPNVFIHSGSGNDAIQVSSGRNVLDGGLGSNFLTGGSGADTFFTDARNPGAVWNTIRNFHEGSAATLWGFVAGVSSYRWESGLAGAVGSEGATLRANIVGGKGRVGDGIDASITFTGMSVEQAQKLQIVTGSQPAGSYLFIYNPGV